MSVSKGVVENKGVAERSRVEGCDIVSHPDAAQAAAKARPKASRHSQQNSSKAFISYS